MAIGEIVLGSLDVKVADRLVHHADIVTLDAESFRLKEARERSELRAASRQKAPRSK